MPHRATGHGHSAASTTRAQSAPHFLLERLSGVADAGERRARAVGSAVGGTARDTGSSLASSAVSAIEQRAPAVRDLPVGGFAPLLSRASAVAREAATEVAEQAAALPARAGSLVAASGEAGKGLLPPIPDPAGVLAGAEGRAEAGAQEWHAAAANGTEPPVGPTAAHDAAAGKTDLAGRADELLEILEDRLIAELERRGGRFAGVF